MANILLNGDFEVDDGIDITPQHWQLWGGGNVFPDVIDHVCYLQRIDGSNFAAITQGIVVSVGQSLTIGAQNKAIDGAVLRINMGTTKGGNQYGNLDVAAGTSNQTTIVTNNTALWIRLFAEQNNRTARADNVFVDDGQTPIGGPMVKYWNGTEWVEKPLKYWNGTEWVNTGTLKYWNGTTWVAT